MRLGFPELFYGKLPLTAISDSLTPGVVAHQSVRIGIGMPATTFSSPIELSVLSWPLIYPRTLVPAGNPLDPADDGNGGYMWGVGM